MTINESAILLVDDEPQLLEIFGFWLAAAGCRNVHTAANGEGALAVLRITSIDLLVTDVRMPVMDGITLVRRLVEMGKSIPNIIFVSGFGDIDEREMYAAGAERFLAKPLRREDFIEVVEGALAERRTLWLTPMDVAPRQSMLIEVTGIGEMVKEDSILLGRGGFCARTPEFLSLGTVAFRCGFPLERREMSGQGCVRWHSKTDQTVGIEFAFLDPSCRSWLLEEITASAPKSFIPNFRGEAHHSGREELVGR
jgi:CheY-like chemotaxis protein